MLKEFADRFVNEEFRERFLHEAARKPSKLNERVCHQIECLFDKKYKNGAPIFAQEETCIVLTSGGQKTLPWSKASLLLGIGEGVLIISESGRKFVAETEGSPRAEKYGAGE